MRLSSMCFRPALLAVVVVFGLGSAAPADARGLELDVILDVGTLEISPGPGPQPPNADFPSGIVRAEAP